MVCHKKLRSKGNVSDFDYGKVIERILEKNRWGTEGALAKALGVVPNTWTSYKNGKQSFGLHEIARICDVLQVDPRWLLFGDEPQKPSLMEKIEEIVREAFGEKEIDEEVALELTRRSLAKIIDQLVSTDDDEEVELRLRLLRKELKSEVSLITSRASSRKRVS
jgi:transcriptional regulator with XRE-family HTH domain